MSIENRRVYVSQRPRGAPGPANFQTSTGAVVAPEAGEVLIETRYVSVDPAMRVWMSEDPGYVAPIELGETMRSGGIGRVIESNYSGLAVGDLVQGRLGWQSHPTLPGQFLQKLDLALGDELDWMGPLGGTALTAYFGMKQIAGVASGETVLVSAAAGGVGQIAGQIARLESAGRVVGIAGGSAKCDFLKELGFDGAIDYRATENIAAAIAEACPSGIDVYFDNVGGPTLDGALAQLNLRARIALCGRISQTALDGGLYGVQNLGMLIGKRARLEGFIVTDFSDDFELARQWLSKHLKAGDLKQRLHVVEGLEQAPAGLAMLFSGENTGKLVVRVS